MYRMAVCGFSRGTYLSIPCKELGQATCENRCWQHCSWALAHNNKMLSLHQKRLTEWQLNEKYMEHMDEWLDHGEECHSMIFNREKKTRNGKYNGPFAFTLTKSPDWGISEEDMMNAVRKIMYQQSQPVKKFAWFLEYKVEETKQHPHIHGMYETENGRRIEKKHWVRAWPKWNEDIKLGAGFVGGYHRPVREDDAYSKYIAKNGGEGEYNL